MDTYKGIEFEVIPMGEVFPLKPVTIANMSQRPYRRFARIRAFMEGTWQIYDLYTSYSVREREYADYVVREDREALRCDVYGSVGSYTSLERALRICRYLLTKSEFWWPLSDGR